MATLQEMLTEVETAISQLVTGAKSYTIAGRTVTKTDLKELRAWRSELKQEIGQAEGGAARTYMGFPTI